MKRLVFTAILLALGAGALSLRAQIITNPALPTATSLTVSTLTTGTVLDVRPSISADGRYVTLGIHLQQSILDGIDTFNSGGQLLSSSQNQSNQAQTAGFPLNFLAPPAIIGFGPQPPYRPAVVKGVTFVEKDRTILATPAPALKADSLGLREAANHLAASTKLNIVLSANALRQAKIYDKRPLALDLPAQPLKQSIVDLLSAAAPGQPMVVTAEDKVIFVTTQAQGDTMVVTKTYFTTDLIMNSPRWLPAGIDLSGPRPPEQVTAAEPALEPTPPPARPKGLFDDDPPPPAKTKPAPVHQQERSVAELITRNLRPEIWKANGGKIGEVHEYGGRVTITAPESVHALLEGPSYRPSPNQAPLYVGYSTGGAAIAR